MSAIQSDAANDYPTALETEESILNAFMTDPEEDKDAKEPSEKAEKSDTTETDNEPETDAETEDAEEPSEDGEGDEDEGTEDEEADQKGSKKFADDDEMYVKIKLDG